MDQVGYCNSCADGSGTRNPKPGFRVLEVLWRNGFKASRTVLLKKELQKFEKSSNLAKIEEKPCSICLEKTFLGLIPGVPDPSLCMQ